MSFTDVMDFIGKFFVGALIGFLAMYFVAIIVQTVIAVKALKKNKQNSLADDVPSNAIVIELADKKDKDFYSRCIFILNTYKVSAFCQLFSDDIDKSIEVINTTSDDATYVKHVANIITYFNIYSYEHLLDNREKEKVLTFINSKLAMVNDTAKEKLNTIAEVFTDHLDETAILFASHYSMLTKDTKLNMLKQYAGKKYFLPKLNL